MAEDTVAVLMSTYNGERYLKEQIESIITQSFSNWQLYIRDDGSTDHTVSIINEFVHKDKRIIFLNANFDKNLGVTRSFMKLLESAEANYYMFSDQDDYWKKDKIELTLKKMQDAEEKFNYKPICVHTNLTIVDNNLNGNLLMKKPEDTWSNFKQLLFKNCVTGCTMMINQALKRQINFNDKKLVNVYLHDWWIALIAAAFGKVIYLEEPTILYRQHVGNLVGSNIKGTAWYNNTVSDPVNERVIQSMRIIRDFWNAYGNQLQGTNKKYTEKYAKLIGHANLLRNFITVLHYPPVRPTIRGDILFGFLVVKNFKEINQLEIDKEKK